MVIVYQLLRQRHNYYRALLAVELVALLGLRGLEQAPRLVSAMYLLIAGVGVLLDSPLLPKNRLSWSADEPAVGRRARQLHRAFLRRRIFAGGWLVALFMELSWQAALVFNPALAVQLSAPHLVIWLALMLQVLWGLVNALSEEPIFSGDLIMGAAAGYLLVGFTGGIVLNSLLVLDPTAFQLPANPHPLPDGIGHAPAMLGAAFASLTTIGSPVLSNGSLTSLTAGVAITIVGQLYVAILIAGILSKPRQIAAVRRSAHQQRRPKAAISRLKR